MLFPFIYYYHHIYIVLYRCTASSLFHSVFLVFLADSKHFSFYCCYITPASHNFLVAVLPAIGKWSRFQQKRTLVCAQADLRRVMIRPVLLSNPKPLDRSMIGGSLAHSHKKGHHKVYIYTFCFDRVKFDASSLTFKDKNSILTYVYLLLFFNV